MSFMRMLRLYRARSSFIHRSGHIHCNVDEFQLFQCICILNNFFCVCKLPGAFSLPSEVYLVFTIPEKSVYKYNHSQWFIVVCISRKSAAMKLFYVVFYLVCAFAFITVFELLFSLFVRFIYSWYKSFVSLYTVNEQTLLVCSSDSVMVMAVII